MGSRRKRVESADVSVDDEAGSFLSTLVKIQRKVKEDY